MNSGFWLHALPSSSLGNLLDNNALRVSVGIHLSAKARMRRKKSLSLMTPGFRSPLQYPELTAGRPFPVLDWRLNAHFF
ncbi:hypothetical protein RvY_03058-1 [Ramazzottius varieornatus]|uniref:Uncharacterized protein n=1 Tax=Ramazzottius varieornatus TaxID=947166 RepID=A0A1D1UQK3_RAMVA|nr:hypothetical protein RvY_03058-1 [Ramazzottius varieornatus]